MALTNLHFHQTMCNNVLQRSIVSLGTKACTPLGIHVDRPRGASGLGRRELVELVELEVPVWAAGGGGDRPGLP